MQPISSKDGLRCAGEDDIHPVHEFHVDAVWRAEGASDPDDMSIAFALRHQPSGACGAYVTSYGPRIAKDDLKVLQSLEMSYEGAAERLPTP
ncbi:MAG: hypothetical protein R3C68_03020 [Myxococcota bacterium]